MDAISTKNGGFGDERQGKMASASGDPPCLAQRLPTNQRAPSALRPMGWSWQERFDKIPQRIWKQRGGHTCSRYVADVGQVLEVLLRALFKALGVEWYDSYDTRSANGLNAGPLTLLVTSVRVRGARLTGRAGTMHRSLQPAGSRTPSQMSAD
jgi:hypothetical protein